MIESIKKNLILSLILFFMTILKINAQSFSIDFENYNNNPIWKKLVLTEDSLAYSGNFVCRCPHNNKFGFGLDYDISDSINNDNAIFSVDMMLRSDSLIKANFVVSITKNDKNILWKSYPLSYGYKTPDEWYKSSFSLLIPNDFLRDSHLNCYVLNANGDDFSIDDFNFKIEYVKTPSYLETPDNQLYPEFVDAISNSSYLNLLYSKDDRNLLLADDNFRMLTKPLSLINRYLCDNDTVFTQTKEWKLLSIKDVVDGKIFNFKSEDRYSITHLKMEMNDEDPNVDFYVETKYKKELNLIRSSLLIPFRDDDFIVYRKNSLLDTVDYQDVYYLDKEGFSVKYEKKQLNLYHPEEVSSLQLDINNSCAYVNIDYHYDHPLVHFELGDTSNFFIDKSASLMKKNEKLTSLFTISLTQRTDLPRIMPLMNGYESGIIWTEHADWADIRTHRATYFGSEDVLCADSAVGGFVFYDIPVTKSVFYNNPDSVRNIDINKDFPGLHTSIKSDSIFYDFLKQLKNKGYDICLHTPEQYTSNRNNLEESLSFMKDNFNSPSWIDHGYNNSIINNREDMLCDGLNPSSPYYVYDLWVKYGVKYPWNGSYEEMPIFGDWYFDNQLLQPYPGFGDAMPLPRVIRFKDYKNIFSWATSSTMEPNSNWAWNYFFSQANLDKIVDYRSVFITHCYSPWVTTQRGYWEIVDEKIVAKHGFNQALQRIKELKDKQLMLPLTISDYMNFQLQQMNLDYRVNDDGSVTLVNNNDETIKGLSLICSKAMALKSDKTFNIKKTKSGDEWIIWFDMLPGEEIVIFNKNNINN